ncbi:MAG: isoprenyl transferase [Oligoflexales bacterium]|nr:isoprenyl transferase [Oligoflexales bacterium]
MDGNGRWANSRKKPRIFGHNKGADRVREIIEASVEKGIEVLTLYAFSEENWGRPEEEVNALFSLLARYLRKEVRSLHRKNIRLRVIGDQDRLPLECQKLLKEGLEYTRNNNGLQLVLALSYGGRSEIVKCCKEIAAMVKNEHICLDEIDQKFISNKLYTAGLPDPDLIIRTSGEQRISNFLLWQLAYSEFYFAEVLWPEFSRSEFFKALSSYKTRDRRYGKIKENRVLDSAVTDN